MDFPVSCHHFALRNLDTHSQWLYTNLKSYTQEYQTGLARHSGHRYMIYTATLWMSNAIKSQTQINRKVQ